MGYIILSVIIFIVICLIVGYVEDKINYHKGICPHCKSKLYRTFTKDVERGYVCKRCGYTAYITFGVDKKYED